MKKMTENTKLKKLVKENDVFERKGGMVSDDDVRGLVLYITNDSYLYHRYAEPFIENLRKKVKRGVYNPELAVKLWKVLADEGTKKYDKEVNDGRGRVDWLNVPTRLAIAKELRDHYQEEVEAIAVTQDPPSNASTMLAALNQLRDWALLDINENVIRSDEPSYKKLVDGIVEIANAALATPPRNCDRFSNFDEAIKTYAKENNVAVPWDMEKYARMSMWLFATVERKGNAK